VAIENGLVHYGDERHEISGEARNLQVTVQPDDPNAPADSWMNTVTLSSSNSTFTYDGRPVNNIEVQARGRVNQTRAEIEELVLRSPVAEARLHGVMDDWRALRYQMNITSSVDLTQLSDTLQSGTTLRGAGNFTGRVTGEGDRFTINGQVQSDALAADGLRLQGLNVSANGSVNGRSYEINGKAVADLLNAGAFRIDSLQLVGNVMGTGTNFRWVGELRAVAERSYGTTLTGLILRDARAEMNDGVLTASSGQFSAGSLSTSGARVNGITASNLQVRNENDVTTATVAKVEAGTISASGAQVDGVTANNIEVADRGGVTSVVIAEVQVGATSAAGAEIGSLNIAGVRLSVRNSRIEGSTADIDAGTVRFADGQAEDVRLARPVFVVEPSGAYRASADLSIGGGVLGSLDMGQVRANLVATDREIQLNNFSASVFDGTASGNARIAIARDGDSQVSAGFNNLDIAGPLTALAGSAVPLSGRATGRVELTFPGTSVALASGTVTTRLSADAGDTDQIPITGEVAVRADRGTFNIQQVNLQTPASRFKATGQFSFENESNLQVDLTSSNAAELQTVLLSSGLLPELGEQMRSYRIELGGQLAFNGSIRGRLISPNVNGRFSLGTLGVDGFEFGALSATVAMDDAAIRVTDGNLAERDGGGVRFSLNAPRTGTNNISVDATLDRFSARTLLALSPLSTNELLTSDTQSDISGQISVTGIPKAMSGRADLRFGPGRLGGEALESMVVLATFDGPNVNVENVDLRLVAGHIAGSGNFNTTTQTFSFQGRADNIQLARLASLAKRPGLPSVTGVANLTVNVSGNLEGFSGYQITFDGEGRDVTINGREVGRIALTGRTENQRLNISLTTGIFGQEQVVAAQINLASPE
jgi:hypothetical protein